MTMQRQILIVEDNDLNRAMLYEILAGDYQVMEAKNGREALEIVQQHGHSISLILLDVMMPVMDGYTFLDLIKKDEELSLIPVIVMTQNGCEEEEVAALAHGATDFAPKPYRPEVLLRRVAGLIKLRKSAAIINQLRYDRLMGLYNKEYFLEKVRDRLAADPQDYCIVCANIDNFKLINDIYGVQAGDDLLKEVANLARDMMGSTGFCARFGADHFYCLQEWEQRDCIAVRNEQGISA